MYLSNIFAAKMQWRGNYWAAKGTSKRYLGTLLRLDLIDPSRMTSSGKLKYLDKYLAIVSHCFYECWHMEKNTSYKWASVDSESFYDKARIYTK